MSDPIAWLAALGTFWSLLHVVAAIRTVATDEDPDWKKHPGMMTFFAAVYLALCLNSLALMGYFAYLRFAA
jgi:hypothetical protein